MSDGGEGTHDEFLDTLHSLGAGVVRLATMRMERGLEVTLCTFSAIGWDAWDRAKEVLGSRGAFQVATSEAEVEELLDLLPADAARTVREQLRAETWL